MNEPGLGHGVTRHVARGAISHQRGDVDDAAAALARDQTRRRLARHQPRALEIGVEHAVPILLTVFEDGLGDGDAGIVDENIDAAQGLFGGIEGLAHAVALGHVADHGRHAPPGLGYSGSGLVQRRPVARHQRHIGARLGQHLRKMLPEAARRAGDERLFPGEREIRHGWAFNPTFP